MAQKWNWINKVGIQAAIIVGIFGIIGICISKLWDRYNKTIPPRFAFKELIIKSDSIVIIVPQNQPAHRKAPLNVEIDGLLFVSAGKLISNKESVSWYFNLKDRNLPDLVIGDGIHHIRVGFPGGPLSESMALLIYMPKPIDDKDLYEAPKDSIRRKVELPSEVPKPAPRIQITEVSSESSEEDRTVKGVVEGFNPLVHEIVVYVEEPRFDQTMSPRFHNQADRLQVNKNDGTWTVEARPGKVFIYVLQKGKVKLDMEPLIRPLHESKASIHILYFQIVD